MKKAFKSILAIAIIIFAALTFTSCDKANLYRKFNNNGSDLAKSHILEEVSYKKLYSLVDKTGTKHEKSKTEANPNGEDFYIYVFFGTPTDTPSCTKVTIWNEQAQQFEISVLYYLDSNLKTSKLNKIQDRLSITNINTVPALWSFKNGKLFFDSSSKKCYQGKDANGVTTIDYSTSIIAEKCFRNLLSVSDAASYQ